jgi:hypothetical protein
MPPIQGASLLARAIIIIGFAWPFVVAVVAGVATAKFGFGHFSADALLPLGLIGAPGVMVGVYRFWPASWSESGRALLALVLAVPIVFAEVLIATQVFLFVYVACGGFIASYGGVGRCNPMA